MKRTLKKALGGAAAAGAIALVMAGAVFVPGVLQAQTAEPTATPTTPNATPDIATRSRSSSGSSTALAAALGITVEELQAARESAVAAAIEQAVADGLLTAEQAAQLQERASSRLGRLGRFGGDIDSDALLADALGITVEALETAKDEARASVLAQAVADGTLTQEEADLELAEQELRDYLSDKVDAFVNQALQDAVSEGIVTQEQLDALQADGFSLRGGGFLGGGGRGHGGHGRGGMDGMDGRGSRGGQTTPSVAPETPQTTPETTPEGNG